MAVTYCTAQQVSNFNQLTAHDGSRIVWGQNVNSPTEEEVNELIETAEELIEKHCNQAWASRFITVANELHDIYRDQIETTFHLNHPNVTPFDDVEGDKLEVWDGTDWIEWLTTYTHGRGDDFFLDQKLGKIYFYTRKPTSGKLRIRVTYRYNGGTTVPKAVTLATALEVGVMLLNTENITILFPEGDSEDLSVSDRIRIKERAIERALRKHVISEVPVGLTFTPIRSY